jgi:UDP:flavonoid glycosyltransferase YjiC (YdhE family)
MTATRETSIRPGRMRVLFTTTGFPGHVLPLLPLARACADAGDDVIVAGPGRAEPVVREAGLAFHDAGSPRQHDLARVVSVAAELPSADGHVHMIREGFGNVMPRALLTPLLQLVASWRPHVVVRESQELSGCLAAEYHGVPHVRVGLGLSSTEAETLSLFAAPVDALRAQIGLASDHEAERLAAEPCLSTVPRPLDAGDVQGLGGVRRFREPAAAIEASFDGWPTGTGPRVYLTFGSVAQELGFFPAVYRQALHALSDVGAHVLVTIGHGNDAGELGPLPPSVRVDQWIPQDAVLPQVDAVVCHGGYGSVVGALAHGRPLVAMPLFAGDHWTNARRVAAVGAGIALEGTPRRMFDHPGDDVIAALPHALERVVTHPVYRQAAQGVAQAIRALPSVEGAVRALHDFARSTQPKEVLNR